MTLSDSTKSSYVHRARRLVRSVPALVWLATGLHVALMATYSLLYMPYANPDEAQHHDIVVAWLEGDGLARPGERILAEGVEEGNQIGRGAFFAHPLVDDEIPPRSERPTFDELGGFARSDFTQPNQITQHPPLYYALLAGVLAVIPGDSGWAWDQGVGFLRLLNVAMLAPLPLLAWAAVRPLTTSASIGSAAAMMPLLLPGLSRIGGSINNDNLLTLLGGILTILLVRVCLGDLRVRLAVGVGVVTGLALLTKGFAMAFLPVIGLAYLVAWWRRRGRPPRKPALAAFAVSFVAGGWWWVANVVRFGTLQPNGFGQAWVDELRGPPAPASLPRDFLRFVDGYFEEISRRIVAWIGLLDPPFYPFWLAALIIGVFILGAVWALLLRKRSVAGPGVVAIGVLPTPLILLILGYGVYENWSTYLRFNGTQGRYLYPALVGMAVVAAAGWSALLGRMQRWLPLGLVVLAGMAHFWSAKIIVAAWWLPPWAGTTRIGEFDVAITTFLRYSPWPVGFTSLLLIGVAVFGLGTLAASLRLTVGERPGPVRAKEDERLPWDPLRIGPDADREPVAMPDDLERSRVSLLLDKDRS